MRIILFVSLFLNVSPKEFSQKVIANIIFDLTSQLHPKCIYIIHANTEMDLRQNLRLIKIRKIIFRQFASIVPEDIYKLTNIQCPPLFVIVYSNNFRQIFPQCVDKYKAATSPDTEDFICESNTTLNTQDLSNRKWLVFKNNDEPLNKFFADFTIPNNSEFLVAQSDTESMEKRKEVALTEVYHIQPTVPLQLYRAANWSSAGGLTWTRVPLKKRRNLQGIKLRVGYLIQPPSFITKEEGKSEKMGGLMVEIWKEFQHRINFSSEFHVVPDKKFGSLNNGIWNGLVGMITRNQVDAVINSLLYTRDRVTAVTLLPPIGKKKFSVYIRQPNMQDTSSRQILEPFSTQLWEAIITAILILTTLLSLCWGIDFMHMTENTSAFHIHWLCVFGSFIQQAHYITPRTWSCRLVFISTNFTSLVVFIAYSATFIPYLTVQQHDLPFTNFQEILQDGTYTIATLPESATRDFFRKSKNPILEQVYLKLILPAGADFSKDEQELLRRACNEDNFGVMTSTQDVQDFHRSMKCRVVQIPRAYFSTTFSMGLQKNSAYKRLFSHHLQEMRRAGILGRIFDSFLPPEKEDARNYTPPSVTMGTVKIFFIILCLGTVASILILFLEILLHSYKICTIKNK